MNRPTLGNHDRSAPIGLVGLGLVGSALYELLLERGYTVAGYDILADRRAGLESAGGIAVESVQAVGERCGTVFLSLLTTDQVRDVVESDAGLLSSGSNVRRIVDTTTGDPNSTVLLEKRLHSQGLVYLDAPLSGSSRQIRDRKAVFLVGGRRRGFDELEQLLKLVTPHVEYVGEPGSGSKAKLVSNLILGLNRLVLAEGFVFAETLGVNLSTILQVLKKTPAYSSAMDAKGEKMIEGNFTAESRISQHRKDLDIILRYASSAGQGLPLTKEHHRILQETEASGYGEMDTSAVLQTLRTFGFVDSPTVDDIG